MPRDSKLPKTNSLLPSINYKQCLSLIILLLVTSPSSQSPAAKFDCPSGCECDESTFSARCDSLDGLIESYSRKQHKSRHNFMPIKSLDLSNNQLTKLTNQLELLVNLTELNLSHNQLTQVHKINFDNLETLDLSHNSITSAKLKKLPKNVIHLNLSYNEITYLPVDFMKLKKLRSLELVGNPLNCTCDTLHVRNWLSYNHVRSDRAIVCSSPATVKGQPWLQARQGDICIEPSTTTQRSKYNWDNYEDDNEIMMGDQPQDGEDDIEYDDEDAKEKQADDNENEDEKTSVEEKTSAEPAEDENNEEVADNEVFDDEPASDVFDETSVKPQADDVTSDYDDDDKDDDEGLIPVKDEHEHETTSPAAVLASEAPEDYDDEGSADETSPAPAVPSEQPDEDSEGSGSGYNPILEGSAEKSESSTLGIFEDFTEAPAVVHKGVLSDAGSTAAINLEPGKANDLNIAAQDDNTGTYILLGVLGICLISLMVFVAVKNRKEKKRNRRYDVEKNGNGATELQDMDKRLLGKPIDRNGNGKAPEQTPLMKDEKPAMAYTSFHPPQIKVDEPKPAPRDVEKSQQSLYENHPNGNGHVEPVHHSPSNGSAPKIPDSDEEVFHPANEDPESLNVSPEPAKRYSPIYTSQSPRSERYSPVYSPETGRVKIKLTETPKPKTPTVVTRSRSRAGDYVNTPN